MSIATAICYNISLLTVFFFSSPHVVKNPFYFLGSFYLWINLTRFCRLLDMLFPSYR